MASVFKRKYTKVMSGRRVKKQSQCWYIKYRNADGIERRIKAFKDKTASQQLAAKLLKEAELAKAGVVGRYKENRKRPLFEHLADFEQSLLAKGATARHPEQTTSRVRRLMNACGSKTWTDISASKLQTVLAEWRHGYKNLSAQTFNFHLKHAKRSAAGWFKIDVPANLRFNTCRA